MSDLGDYYEELRRGLGIVQITEDAQATIARLRVENLELAHRLSYLTEAAQGVVGQGEIWHRALFNYEEGSRLLSALHRLRQLLAKFDTPAAPATGTYLPPAKTSD